MKKTLIILSVLIFPFASYAAFNAIQTGSNPQPGYVLQTTDGFTNTWVSPTSTNVLNTVLYIPTPAQGYSASTCAGSTTVSDYGGCVNALYNSQIGVASSTTIVNPISTVSRTNWITPIVFGDPTLKVTFTGQAGGGTTLYPGITGTGTAITFNGGSGIAAGWGMRDMTIQGLSSNASTTLVEVGGNNISQGFTMTGVNLSFTGDGGTAGIDLAIGSNVWLPYFANDNLGPAAQTVLFNGASNAGESIDFYKTTFYNFSGINGNFGKCMEFGGTTLLDVNLYGGSADNCPAFLDANSGSVAEVHSYGFHFENPGQNTIPTYPFITITSSSGRNVWKSVGDTFLQDAATPPSQFVSNNGDFSYYSPTLSKLVLAGTTTDFITEVSNGATVSGYDPIVSTLGYNAGVGNIIGSNGYPAVINSAQGNVGYGTSTPNYPFVIQGSNIGNVAIGNLIGGSTYGALSVNGDLTTGSYNLTSSPNDLNLYINRPSNQSIQFKENNGTAQMTIAHNGSVGIGTTTPDTSNAGALLQVQTTSLSATTTVELGATGHSKGTCLVMFDQTGAEEYVSIKAGVLVVSGLSCN